MTSVSWINCPFCNAEAHIDGPLGDGEKLEIECRKCERNFEVTAAVCVRYLVSPSEQPKGAVPK